MKETFEFLKKKINPEKSSFIGIEDKEKFKEIKERPEQQFLVSSLVRGVINCAQIIPKPEFDNQGGIKTVRYYSHYQNLDNVVSKKTNDQKRLEFVADSIILKEIFHDKDHELISWDYRNETEPYPKQIEHLNIVVNNLLDEDSQYINFNKYYFFDFGKALVPPSEVKSVSDRRGRNQFIRKIEERKQLYSTYLPKERLRMIFSILGAKCEDLLSTTFNDLNSFKNILKTGFVDLTSPDFNKYFLRHFPEKAFCGKEEKAELMFKEMKDKLFLLRQISEEASKEGSSKAA